MTPREFYALLKRHRDRLSFFDAMQANICAMQFACAPKKKGTKNKPAKDFLLLQP